MILKRVPMSSRETERTDKDTEHLWVRNLRQFIQSHEVNIISTIDGGRNPENLVGNYMQRIRRMLALSQ